MFFAATTSPLWTIPKSTSTVFTCATAFSYTLPARLTTWLPTEMSAAPVVPAPVDAKFTSALPATLPAELVFNAICRLLASVPCAARLAMAPLAEKPPASVPKPALSPSVKLSGLALVTLIAAIGAASPRRATRVTSVVFRVGLASR